MSPGCEDLTYSITTITSAVYLLSGDIWSNHRCSWGDCLPGPRPPSSPACPGHSRRDLAPWYSGTRSCPISPAWWRVPSGFLYNTGIVRHVSNSIGKPPKWLIAISVLQRIELCLIKWCCWMETPSGEEFTWRLRISLLYRNTINYFVTKKLVLILQIDIFKLKTSTYIYICNS